MASWEFYKQRHRERMETADADRAAYRKRMLESKGVYFDCSEAEFLAIICGHDNSLAMERFMWAERMNPLYGHGN